MRKNIKNDKVIKAITIGLATMIAATSAPVDLYAAEDEQIDDSREEKDDSSEEVSVDVEISSEEVSEEAVQSEIQAAEVIADNLTGGELQQTEIIGETPLINAAIASTNDPEIIANLQIAADNINGVAADDEAGIVGIEGVKSELEALEGLINPEANTAQTADAPAPSGETNPGETKQTVSVDPFALSSGKVLPTNANAELTFGEDLTPEFVDDKNMPILVNNEFFSDPQVAGVCDSYDNAIDAIKDKDLDSARKYADEGDAKVEAAQNTVNVLKNAIQDSAAAAAAAEQAQKKADQLKAARDAYYNQYNALMIQYYRDNNTCKYNPDGTLDAKASADALTKKLGETGKDNRSQNALMLGRDLLKKMVTFGISQYDDVDPDSIVFGVEVKKDANGKVLGKEAKYDDEGNLILNKTPNECKMLEGKVFESDDNASDGVHGLEQVVTTSSRAERGSKVKNLQANAIQGMNWYEYQPDKVDGRTHRVKVTYKDNGGNEHAEYYNYIFKNPVYDEEDPIGDTDYSKGIIYVLKEVEENGERKQVPFGTLDDYDLLKAADEIQKKVDAAAEEVQNLRKQILDIARIATSGIEIENDGISEDDLTLDQLQDILEAKLEIAQGALDNSKANLKALHQLINYLEETGFPEEDTDDDDDDDSDDGGETGGTVIPGPGGFTYTIPGGYTLPTGLLSGLTGTTGGTTTGSGVLGVRTGGGQEENDEGRKDEGIAPRADFNTVNKVLGSTQNKKDSQLLKRIKNNEIPLAEIPNMDDEVKMNWMWLLIIFLLGATGKKMYDNYMKKAEEAKQNAENK